MEFFSTYLQGGMIILGMMLLLWIISLLIKNSSIVDIFWGLGFVLVCWFYFLLTPNGFLLRKFILLVLSTIWGLRLTLHVLIRNFGKGEDFRYQKWRSEAPKIWWLKSLFQVFLLQGLLMWIISVPLLAAQLPSTAMRWNFVDYLGIFLWVVGFVFESVGDAQLVRFKSNPSNKGKVLSSGVWRYSRHPNYFGDSAQWWGYFAFALAGGGWWSFFSPVLMTLFLIKVSGVALLERTIVERRPEYAEYIRTTSAFIPWFPRKSHK
jgi:steroid 5-alpha reductase family enzyme